MQIPKVILIYLALFAPLIEADPNMAYLVVEATVIDKNTDQPNWIALNNGAHLPADHTIFALRPGK
ncbi:MAG: hypothetical protein ACKVHQ_04875 [Gammaproteobacteria bacterium]|jgi:hypothetical protein